MKFVYLRNRLKSVGFFRWAVVNLRILFSGPSFLRRGLLLLRFYKDLWVFSRGVNSRFTWSFKSLHPCIFDKTTKTPVGAVYFYQDSWCAGKVFLTRPEKHIDIGSKAEMVGIISQFVPTTMVDIRPIGLTLSGLEFLEGDLLSLPFESRSVQSLSSICVIEHIGLGRYGDKIDPFGSEKAARELLRVLAPNGNLFISVPIDAQNIIHFNAHRVFTREYILELFSELSLIEERYIYGDELCEKYDPARGFGTGLFHFFRPLS